MDGAETTDRRSVHSFREGWLQYRVNLDHNNAEPIFQDVYCVLNNGVLWIYLNPDDPDHVLINLPLFNAVLSEHPHPAQTDSVPQLGFALRCRKSRQQLHLKAASVKERAIWLSALTNFTRPQTQQLYSFMNEAEPSYFNDYRSLPLRAHTSQALNSEKRISLFNNTTVQEGHSVKRRFTLRELVKSTKGDVSRLIWNELDDVKSSSILETMSVQDMSLESMRFTFVTTEIAYNQELNELVHLMKHSTTWRNDMPSYTRRTLTAIVEKVRKCSDNMVCEMEQSWQKNVRFNNVFLILQKGIASYDIFITYCNHLQELSDLLRSGMEKKGDMANLTYSSLYKLERIYLPIFRLKTMCKQLESFHRILSMLNLHLDRYHCKRTLSQITEIMDECNKAISSASGSEFTRELHRKLERCCENFLNTKFFELSNKAREMEEGAKPTIRYNDNTSHCTEEKANVCYNKYSTMPSAQEGKAPTSSSRHRYTERLSDDQYSKRSAQGRTQGPSYQHPFKVELSVNQRDVYHANTNVQTPVQKNKEMHCTSSNENKYVSRVLSQTNKRNGDADKSCFEDKNDKNASSISNSVSWCKKMGNVGTSIENKTHEHVAMNLQSEQEQKKHASFQNGCKEDQSQHNSIILNQETALRICSTPPTTCTEEVSDEMNSNDLICSDDSKGETRSSWNGCNHVSSSEHTIYEDIYHVKHPGEDICSVNSDGKNVDNETHSSICNNIDCHHSSEVIDAYNSYVVVTGNSNINMMANANSFSENHIYDTIENNIQTSNELLTSKNILMNSESSEEYIYDDVQRNEYVYNDPTVSLKPDVLNRESGIYDDVFTCEQVEGTLLSPGSEGSSNDYTHGRIQDEPIYESYAEENFILHQDDDMKTTHMLHDNENKLENIPTYSEYSSLNSDEYEDIVETRNQYLNIYSKYEEVEMPLELNRSSSNASLSLWSMTNWRSSLENSQTARQNSDIDVVLQAPFDEAPLYQEYCKNEPQLIDDGTNFRLSSSDKDNAEEESQENVYETVGEYSPTDTMIEVARRFNKQTNILRSDNRRTQWCETLEVKASGLLDKMTINEKKLQEAKFEIITSEVSFLKSLNILDNLFVKNLDLNHPSVLSQQDKQNLFLAVLPVRDLSECFLKDLVIVWEEDLMLRNLHDVISEYATRKFRAYIAFCANQIIINRALEKLREKNKKFMDIVFEIQKKPSCHMYSLQSFLMQPLQRITRFPILVEAILKYLPPDSDEYSKWKKLHTTLLMVVNECNEAVRRSERTYAQRTTKTEKNTLKSFWNKIQGKKEK